MKPAATTTLPPAPDSVPLARGFVRGALLALGAAGACDDAETLVSELATNAVLHARSEFTIEVVRVGDTVRVRVHDVSGVMPQQRSYGPESTTGRGMRLVASLSSAWGAELEDDGKSVWFDLAADGNPAFVPAWDDVDMDALLASYDEPVRDGEAPPLAPRLPG